MSDTQKLIDMMASGANNNMNTIGKIYSVLAWGLIVMGGLLTLTVIGAVVGIPLVLMGIGLLLYIKSVKKKMAAIAPVAKGAASEIAAKITQPNETSGHSQVASDEQA